MRETSPDPYPGTLRTELVDDEDYRTKDEARASLFHYIEAFYNRRRRHSYPDYLSPVEFEAKHASSFISPLNWGKLSATLRCTRRRKAISGTSA